MVMIDGATREIAQASGERIQRFAIQAQQLAGRQPDEHFLFATKDDCCHPVTEIDKKFLEALSDICNEEMNSRLGRSVLSTAFGTSSSFPTHMLEYMHPNTPYEIMHLMPKPKAAICG